MSAVNAAVMPPMPDMASMPGMGAQPAAPGAGTVTAPTATVATTSALASPAAAPTASPVSGGGAADAGIGVAQLIPVLQGLVDVLGQLVSVLQAQYGAGGISGGGGSAGGCDSGVPPVTTPPVAPAQTSIPAAAPVAPAPVVAPPAATVPTAPAVVAQPVATVDATSGGGGAQAAPSTEPVAIDTRRLFGTPTPGGIIDQVLKSASTTAMPAMSEGEWGWLQESNGAALQVHLHGKWATSQDGLSEAITAGKVMVHLHPDGTLHLHDVSN